MGRTRIKICGVSDQEIALSAAEAGADAIGLVFVDGSPRQISMEQAKTILEILPPFVEPIALFVDDPCERVRQTAMDLGVQTVQLHGAEAPEFASDLAPLRVIKSLPFDENICEAVARWRGAAKNLDAIVLDTPPAVCSDGGSLTGGSGRTFDWSKISRLRTEDRIAAKDCFVLAGGLTPDNVAAAIKQIRPYAVDVSSGVESSRGVKDPNLIRAFCAAVRSADAGV